MPDGARRPDRGRSVLGVVIGVFALVLCCAGPALIAGGALSAIGTALRSPVVIAIGVALVLVAVSITLGRRAHGAGAKPNDKQRSERKGPIA